MHEDTAFQETFALYMAKLPGPEVLFTPEMYSDEDLAALQTPELVSRPTGTLHRTLSCPCNVSTNTLGSLCLPPKLRQQRHYNRQLKEI